ncbi:MAG: hypothetical protein WC640_02330 [Candidatus Paceibacterota bacterium]|jgi:hypothetical protein
MSSQISSATAKKGLFWMAIVFALALGVWAWYSFVYRPDHQNPQVAVAQVATTEIVKTDLASLNIGTEDFGWLPVVWMEGVDSASGLSAIIISLDPSNSKDTATWRPAIMRTGGFNPDKRSYSQIADNASVGGFSTVAHIYSKITHLERAPFSDVFFVGGGEYPGNVAYANYLAEQAANKKKP